MYNQYLPTIYTLAAAKQVGLNCFPPNSTPSATAFHRSNRTNLFSLRSLRILWFLRFPIFGGLVFFLNGEGLDLESVQSQQKESGRSNWAAGGETVDAQPMLDDGGEGFLLRSYSILFLQKSLRNRCSWNVNSSRFPVEYTRCHIQYSPPIYESEFGVPTSDFTPQKQTITKHVHIHSWSLHDSMVDSQSMVNGKYFFSYIEMDLYNQYHIPTIYTLAAAKQVGLNCFPPNSTPSATAFHRSNPTNLFSLRSLRILWFLRFPIFGGLVFFLNGEGLDLESVQSQQKESGRSNWAAGGETVDAQPMLDDGGEGFLWLRDYSLFFSLAKIAS